MTQIRLITFYEAPDCWNITDPDLDNEIDEQLEKYVANNVDSINSPGFEIEDFEIPDNLMIQSNKQFVFDICQGKSFDIWSYKSVDFSSEYYQNWIYFKNKNNSWEILENN